MLLALGINDRAIQLIALPFLLPLGFDVLGDIFFNLRTLDCAPAFSGLRDLRARCAFGRSLSLSDLTLGLRRGFLDLHRRLSFESRLAFGLCLGPHRRAALLYGFLCHG